MPVQNRALASGRTLASGPIPIGQQFILIGCGSIGFQIYKWSSAGIGAWVGLCGSVQAGTNFSADGCKFHPNGTGFFGVWADSGPPLAIYPWSGQLVGNGTTQRGDGYRAWVPYTDGSVGIDAANCVAVSPNKQYVAIGMTFGGPFANCSVVVFPILSNGVLGAPIYNPDPGSALTAQGISWSPDGAYLAVVGGGGTPTMLVWNWTGSAFGSLVAAPASPPAGASARSIKWSPDGTTVVVASSTSPFVYAYPWSAGFGTKYADPVTLPGSVFMLAWSPDGAYIGGAHQTTPFVSVYPWSAGFGARVANPASLPANNGRSIFWSPDGTYVFVGHTAGVGVSLYPWSAGFGTKNANPATAIGGIPTGVDWFV